MAVTHEATALALELTLPAPYIIANQIIEPAVFALKAKLRTPIFGTHFPTTLAPNRDGFTDVYSDFVRIINSFESGRALINPQFTFDGRTLTFMYRHVSDINKVALETYYATNKSGHIFWYNEQDEVTYVVIFADRPRCVLDGENTFWKIKMTLQVIV